MSEGTVPAAGRLRDDLQAIWRAGLGAADPEPLVASGLRGSAAAGWTFRGEPLLPPAPGEPLFLFGAGKAAAALGQAVRRRLEEEQVSGRIIVKHGHRLDVPGVPVEEAGHPVPDAASMAGTRRLLGDLRARKRRGRFLLLITGGASALLVAPAPGITFEEKARVNALLLASGANIHEINTVRKHLSAVKGGQLLPFLPPERSAALVISDVVGDDLTSIGSGPAVADPTTFAEALSVLRRFGILKAVPAAVRTRLEEGAARQIPETPNPRENPIPHHILASNPQSLEAAAREAARLGYRTEVFGRELDGEVHPTARAFAARLAELASRPGRRALVGGGELTLRLQGEGVGGRSQEFALVAARELHGVADVALLAAGTDGTDGPTDAAGAFADGATWGQAQGRDLDPADHLARNDSWNLFRRTGDLFRTGPTGTNVMDLMIGLSAGAAAAPDDANGER